MDPTQPLNTQSTVDEKGGKEVTLKSILQRQLKMADAILKLLEDNPNEFTPRDIKDFLSAASSIANLSHRTESLQQDLETYQLFAEVVMEFLRSRSDQVGEDLVAELKRVGSSLRASQEVGQVVASV